MVSASTAKKAFAKSRKYYEDTFKSANKSYDENSTSVWKRLTGKAAKRNAMRPIAEATLSSSRESLEGSGISGALAEGKLHYQSHMPAANCGELANVACYLLSADGVGNEEIAVGYLETAGATRGVTKSADHAFCVYGNPDFLLYLTDYPLTIAEVGDKTMFEDQVFAIDPWSNIVCPIRKYPSAVAKKMSQWSKYGKRVLWVHGGPGGGAEWTSPGGEYSGVFAAATLRLSRC